MCVTEAAERIEAERESEHQAELQRLRNGLKREQADPKASTVTAPMQPCKSDILDWSYTEQGAEDTAHAIPMETKRKRDTLVKDPGPGVRTIEQRDRDGLLRIILSEDGSSRWL